MMTRCCIWRGATNSDGYGVRRVGDQVRYVHALAWEAENGPVPEGHELDHLCTNRACYRVDHLQVVTHAVNCRRGRSAKLNPEQAAEIRASSEPIRALAEQYGVHNSTISRVRTGTHWAEAA
jgi:hypothetical protein